LRNGRRSPINVGAAASNRQKDEASSCSPRTGCCRIAGLGKRKWIGGSLGNGRVLSATYWLHIKYHVPFAARSVTLEPFSILNERSRAAAAKYSITTPYNAATAETLCLHSGPQLNTATAPDRYTATGFCLGIRAQRIIQSIGRTMSGAIGSKHEGLSRPRTGRLRR